MATKSFFVLCASALLVKTISGQSLGNALAAEELALTGGLGGPLGFGAGLPLGPMGGFSNFGPNNGMSDVAPTSGGGFAVTSASPIAPTGINVFSENAFEGPLAVTGQLPFLGAVALEGALPTAGAGAINYGCGNGNVGIVSESLGPSAPVGPAYGPAIGAVGPSMGPGGPARMGYGAGLSGPGMGLNGLGGGFGGMY